MARHLGCQGERRLDHSEDGRSSRNLTRGAPSIQELLVLTLCCRGRDLLGALRVDQWEPGRRVDHALPTRCCVLQVSRSGFYAWQHRPLSPRAQRDVPLRVRFRSFHARSRGRYGIHVQRSGVGGAHTSPKNMVGARRHVDNACRDPRSSPRRRESGDAEGRGCRTRAVGLCESRRGVARWQQPAQAAHLSSGPGQGEAAPGPLP